jgi:adenine phosphoribosyltransferase
MCDQGVASNSNNWMSEYQCLKTGLSIDRYEQIDSVLQKLVIRYCMRTVSPVDMQANLGYDLNFKKGVVFKDVGPIMRSRVMFDLFMYKCMSSLLNHQISRVDYVAGIDARGFYFGPLLAERLGGGFIPIRKRGKLPGKTRCIEYSTEYSTDAMEIQTDAFELHHRSDKVYTVLIVDDLVATGGSLIAACNLIRQFPCLEIVGCFCPLQVDGLVETARTKLNDEGMTKLITLDM